MRRSCWGAFAILAAACFSSSTVTAQTDTARIESAFAAADVNSDGGVNIDEFVAYFIGVFRSLDEDGNGLLGRADLTNTDPAAFDRADRDSDGGISLEEAIADRIIIFFRADVDEDGVLTLSEISSYDPS